jgi:iron complex transport system ATP-binding protein
MSALELEQIAVHYGARTAVEPTSACFPDRELVGLVGPNGAGKTSLLKAIAGLIGHEGRVRWDGGVLADLPPRQRARLLAYLPQAAHAEWPLAVRDVVGLGRLPYLRFGAAMANADRSAVDWAMQQTEVASLADRATQELSGGELARVMLARALAVKAPVLLADEPVSALDPYHQLQLMEALREHARAGQLVIAVLHDLSLAARFCERVLLMHEGRVVADGAPLEVLDAPRLRRYYRLEPLLYRHDGQPVILPWRRLD